MLVLIRSYSNTRFNVAIYCNYGAVWWPK